MAGGTAPLTYAALPWQVFREGLYEVLKQEAEKFDSKIPLIYRVAQSNREWEELLTASGIGPMPYWDADGKSIPYTAPQTRYLTTITHLDFAQGVSYTLKMRRALKYPSILQAAQDLGVSAMDARETLAASLFNNGFTTNWTDGVPLFSGSHPLADGTTASNLASGAFSLANLEAAVLLLETTPDDMGRPMGLTAQAVVYPPALRFAVQRALWSPDDPTTANRAINPIERRGLQLIEWPYLTSNTAWFVIANRRWLFWFDREPLTSAIVEDKKDNYISYHNARMSCSCGAGDWRGIVGSTGV